MPERAGEAERRRESLGTPPARPDNADGPYGRQPGGPGPSAAHAGVAAPRLLVPLSMSSAPLLGLLASGPGAARDRFCNSPSMDKTLPTAESRGPGRRAEDAAADEARRILGIVEELNAIQGTDDLLDRLTEQAARLAGYGAGVLALTLPEAALVGTWNLPEEDRARFRRRSGRAEIAYRVEKRRRIRRYAFPGTGICYVPHDADLFGQPVSDAYEHIPRPEGTWDARDRLFLLVRGTAGREIGLCSLDFPGDGNAPTAENLGSLRLAERLLAVGGNLVEIRLLQDSLRRGEEEMRLLVEDAPV